MTENTLPPTDKALGYAVEDKPTPTLGKILLFIMAVLLLFLGTKGLTDVYELVPQPESLSPCIQSYVSIDHEITNRPYERIAAPYFYNNEPQTNCQFSALETKHNIPRLYAEYKLASQSVSTLRTQLSSLQSNQSTTLNLLQDARRRYNLALGEDIANRPETAYNPVTIQQEVSRLESESASLSAKITALNRQITEESNKLTPEQTALQRAGLELGKDYQRQWSLYRLYVFILQVLFTFPVFLLCLKQYFRLKAKDSPYTLILTTLVGVTGILFAGVALRYLWTLFLAELLSNVWSIIRNVPLLRTIVFYLGMFLVVIIFGGSVYLIQKRIFDPKRVYRRRLRKGQCPDCETPLELSVTHCPECGTKIKEKCANCNELRYSAMPYCPHCGQK